MAFESLLSNKTRTVLSMLGIIIGVSTVIAVFGVGKGVEATVNKQFQGLSANSLLITSNQERGATASSKFKASDGQVIKDKAEHIKDVTVLARGSATVSFGKESGNFSAMGVGANYFQVSNYKIASGRFFDDAEVLNRAKTIVLGSTAVETLFPDGGNPLGQSIVIKGKNYEIIGVLSKIGSSFGPVSPDESLFIPYTTAEANILGEKAQVMINATVDDINNVALAIESVTAVLREAHDLKSGQADDFRIRDAGSMVATAQESAKLMTTFLMVIAAITLLVSGIGIMNVMFVTVAERTKEIGIAKAIGGKQSDILSQFLLESVVLSMIGGLLGILLGSGALLLINRSGLITIAYTLQGPIIGFSFSVFVGVFFGFVPAFKASRLDPVDALRSE